MKTFAAAAIAVLSLAFTGPGYAATIYLQDFESGSYPGWSTNNGAGGDALVLDSNTVVANNPGSTNSSGTDNHFLVFGSTDNPNSNSYALTVQTVPAGTYNLFFSYGSFSDDPTATQSMDFLVNGNLLGHITTLGSSFDVPSVFQTYDFVFTSLDPTLQIQLEFHDVSTVTANVDGFLDNVGISTAPLPPALPLFAAGLVGIGLLLRRKPAATAARKV